MGIGPDINETSLIARLKHKKHRVLFAGDLNRKLSNFLVEKYPDRFHCDILMKYLIEMIFFYKINPPWPTEPKKF